MDMNPWVFKRDEMDMLEEKVDAIFDAHEKTKDKAMHDMEEIVLKEQNTFEEKLEKEVLDEIGSGGVIKNIHTHRTPWAVRSIQEQLSSELKRDPLYEVVTVWTNGLYEWAHHQYTKREDAILPVYRIYLYSCIIPLKLSFSLQEVHSGEANSNILARKELTLAQEYVRLIIKALEALIELDRDIPFVLFIEAKKIEELLAELQSKLGASKPY